MDRDAIARNQRRRQIEEARAEEQGRELALAERLEELVTEREGEGVDADAFARMEPEDVALVREVLDVPVVLEDEDDAGEDDPGADDTGEPDGGEDADAETEAEIARLQSEIAESQRRQLAYVRYLDALDSRPPSP